MSDEPSGAQVAGELNFSRGTCHRHREMFVDIVWTEGIRDPTAMERVRMMVVAQAAKQLTEDEVFAYLHRVCVGCVREDWIVDIVQRVAREEIAWLKVSPDL